MVVAAGVAIRLYGWHERGHQHGAGGRGAKGGHNTTTNGAWAAWDNLALEIKPAKETGKAKAGNKSPN